jgi:LPXTG-motif cell wall-anchored protein
MDRWKRVAIWLAILGVLLVVRVSWNIPLNHEEIAAIIGGENFNSFELLLGLAMIVIGAVLFVRGRKHVV